MKFKSKVQVSEEQLFTILEEMDHLSQEAFRLWPKDRAF